MKKRTKMIIITAMVLLLGVTGYLNIMLNNSVSEKPSEQTTTTATYFSTYRATRESTRDQELLYYDAIISNEASSSEAISNAENLKLSLISQMENELVIEGLIKAKGFDDCIVSILDENVNAVVKAKELTSSEVAQILSVIQSQLSISLENVTIIPVE